MEALQNDLKASKQTLRDTQAQQEAQLSSLKDQIEAAKTKGKEALEAQRKRSAEREHKAQKEHKAQMEDLQKQLREALEKNAQESALVQGSRQKLEKDLKDALPTVWSCRGRIRKAAAADAVAEIAGRRVATAVGVGGSRGPREVQKGAPGGGGGIFETTAEGTERA